MTRGTLLGLVTTLILGITGAWAVGHVGTGMINSSYAAMPEAEYETLSVGDRNVFHFRRGPTRYRIALSRSLKACLREHVGHDFDRLTIYVMTESLFMGVEIAADTRPLKTLRAIRRSAVMASDLKQRFTNLPESRSSQVEWEMDLLDRQDDSHIQCAIERTAATMAAVMSVS